MSDWDAQSYRRLSEPQLAWGLEVLDRLQPSGGEAILDIGCGPGRLTAALHDRRQDARIVALDRSWAMVSEARRRLPLSIPVIHADAVKLPLESAFDAVFSTATFHWVRDHDALFQEIHRVLRPGGRLIAQAGGGANLASLHQRAGALASDPVFAARFEDWTAPWFFAGVDDTERRLRAAGFSRMSVWLRPAPTSFADPDTYRAFVATVCLRPRLERLTAQLQEQFLDRIVTLAAADDPPYTLDYWRLNIDAHRS